mgnify:CR=1 FL=1
MAAEAEVTQTGMNALCATTDPGKLDAVRERFRSLVRAYSRSEFALIGPITEDNRAERLLFWPDTRGIGRKQVERIIRTRDESATSVATLATKSVATQGLGALEYVLFGTGADDMTQPDHATHRCAYGLAITKLIAKVTSEIDADWQNQSGSVARLLHPAESNLDYRIWLDSGQAVINILAHGLEAVHDTRILPLVGTGANDINPRLALWWRSGMTLEALSANLEGLSQLVAVAGFEQGLPEDQRWLAGSIMLEFDNAGRILDQMDGQLEDILADSSGRERLRYLQTSIRALQREASSDLARALGVSVGLSALDGD